MKYYVTADVHAYFTELQTALREQGFSKIPSLTSW